MRRVFVCGVLAVSLHIASLSAQQPAVWGDELPPAPALPDTLLAIPRIDFPLVPPTATLR